KKEAARSHNTAAVIFGAGIPQSLLRQLRIFAKRNFPNELAGIEIDGVQGAPGRLNSRVTVGIEKLVVSVEAVLQIDRGRLVLSRFDGTVFAIHDVPHDCCDLLTRKPRERWHAPTSLPDHLLHFALIELVSDIH